MSGKKPDRPEMPIQKRVEVLHWVGEAERICGNCEHFDLGSGGCHNGISGCLKTMAGNNACMRGFYPCTIRFPLHVRLQEGEKL